MQQDIQDIIEAEQGWREYLEYPEHRIPSKIFDRVFFGENAVRVYHEWRGYSVKELSAKTGISEQAIYGIENGNRVGHVENYQKIATALNLPLDDIVPVKRQLDEQLD